MGRTIPAGIVLATSLLGLATAARPSGQEKKPASAAELFLGQVQPILKKHCLGCHGDEPKLRGGLDLRSRAALLKGGESGPAVIPGDAARSLLYQAVLRRGELKMPPKDENRLAPSEIDILKTWIDAGAPWPDPRAVAKGGPWKVDPRDAWAFQPVKDSPVPADEARSRWVRTPLDAFILQRQRAKGLSPAPPADRLTLIRRATFDLTGLPPTPQEIDAFRSDRAADAYERLIERLLAAPRYGERWGRHWLDVVRYADTAGYSNDYERPNAWRYRDYVIRAFNTDKPFDRFVLEQLAGDELVPDDPECQVAVGYLRMGPWEHTGMSVAAVTRQMFLDDVTNAVGTTFLALPLSCCRCHDHKFDPLPARDYYRVQAVFAPAQFAEQPVPFLACENTTSFSESAEQVQERIERTEARLKAIGLKPAKGEQEELRRAYRKRLEYYKLEAKRYQPLAFSVVSRGTPDVHILAGGSLGSPGAKVTAGVLSAVHRADDSTAPTAWNSIPQHEKGRRLAFARWVASAQNPLTARVLVNRVWQGHFGKGLVETSNNFGKMGKRPTHPELLDWLAREFVAPSPQPSPPGGEGDKGKPSPPGGEGRVRGWSIKALHRLIMTSAVYRQSGQHPDLKRVRQADPLNELLAYFPPRRLTAEELRDSVLSVAGELSQTAGGPPVRPEINRDMALQPRQIMGALAPMYEPSPTREQRNRRTVYTAHIRTLANPLLEVFNAPNPDTACERRDESTVTPQVFALFNSRFTHDMALAMARRLEGLERDPAGRVERAFRLAYGRPPSERERSLCLAHFEKMLAHHRSHPPAKEELPRRIVRERIAEFTGERVQIVEDWDPAGYEPHLRAWEVSAETRALAEVCLVLLNSNEFVYVY
ncbi:MAG: PSD1 and planctomycete cytochrome C domain-containing protein [Gemmataceae bacterium]|nr:PSD1 and planctomycete cytochrome C domain-containing protein [Gemmataceae bacterium]